MIFRIQKVTSLVLASFLTLSLPSAALAQVEVGEIGTDPWIGIPVNPSNPEVPVVETDPMVQYLNEFVDPRDVVHAFQADAGEWVDCVDLYAQPALKRAGMEGHQIEFRPNSLPLELKSYPDAEDAVGRNLEADTDGDGMLDAVDNCPLVPNAEAANCDTDGDGIGNACDGDFNQDGAVDASDFVDYFLVDFVSGKDRGAGADMDCDGSVTGSDFTAHFIDSFTRGVPGPEKLDDPGRYEGTAKAATLDLGKDGLGCPVGSVPIRRFSLEDLKR